jgi:hypothetical protein
MKRNWDDIQFIFKPDGSLLDIYVQEVSIEDWEKLIDFLNENYTLKYGISEGQKSTNRIDKEYTINFLKDESGEMEIKSVSIDLGGINANCHFFLPDQIEFDIDPKEINSGDDFEKVEKFMTSISETIKNQVTLTYENEIEIPLIKIDVTKNINKALTKEEVIEFFKKRNDTIKRKIGFMRGKFLMKFFPKKLEERLIRSANKPYRSTKKNKNIW